MSNKTRGSAALDKAQRRLAQLKSIDDQLDLGNGLTVATYTQMIEATRDQLEFYNTLLAEVNDARKSVTDMDAALNEMSERMLNGVASKFGKNSKEYAKAGGSTRRRKSQPVVSVEPKPAPIIPAIAVTNGSTNGNGKHPVLAAHELG